MKPALPPLATQRRFPTQTATTIPIRMHSAYARTGRGPRFHTPELGLGIKPDSSTLTGNYYFAACSIALISAVGSLMLRPLVGNSLPFTKIDGVLVTPAFSNCALLLAAHVL